MPQRLKICFVSSRHCRETRSFGAGGGIGTGFSTTRGGGGGGGSTGRTISFSVEHEESTKSRAETTITHLEKNCAARSLIILYSVRLRKRQGSRYVPLGPHPIIQLYTILRLFQSAPAFIARRHGLRIGPPWSTRRPAKKFRVYKKGNFEQKKDPRPQKSVRGLSFQGYFTITTKCTLLLVLASTDSLL